jgi:hypothetical protein
MTVTPLPFNFLWASATGAAGRIAVRTDRCFVPTYVRMDGRFCFANSDHVKRNSFRSSIPRELAFIPFSAAARIPARLVPTDEDVRRTSIKRDSLPNATSWMQWGHKGFAISVPR